ncbi:hypothetical protein JW758_02180 [Candidatus Peregrinibacteria bacterium]|nr:hypothetical protein [Candidatus Peregrinibacteria bacterium]
MTTRSYSPEGFADLLSQETQRGIVDGEFYIECLVNDLLPKIITDLRGEMRLSLIKVGNEIQVTQHPTKLSMEQIGVFDLESHKARKNIIGGDVLDIAA